jgi:hypothetical protein
MTHFKRIVLTASVLLITAVAAARPHNQVLESSIETTADQVTMPTNQGGIVIARSCANCAIQSLRLAPDVELFLNGTKTDLYAFRNALGAATSTPLAIHYRLADSLISRIVLVTTTGR